MNERDRPQNYSSLDGTVNITFYDNGNLKEISVISGTYEVPYNPETGLGGMAYITQIISYNEDQTLNTVSINADTNATFWYSKRDDESICYNCDSLKITK